MNYDYFDRYIDFIIKNADAECPFWNSEYIISEKKNKWNYIDGCMINALLKIYALNHDERIFDFCEKYVSEFVDDNGNIRTYDPCEYNIDNINPAKNLIILYEKTGKQKYRTAFEYIFNEQIVNQPRTMYSNCFWHKKIYPNQIWLDGLYMALPFYAEYDVKYNNCRNTDDVIMQFKNAEKFMRDNKSGLYYHGYDESKKIYWADSETGLSNCFWLRSIGWFMCAVVDTYEKLDGISLDAETVLKRIFINLADNIIKYQGKNGMFLQIVDKPFDNGNYFETSGTLLVAYSIFKAVRLGIIEKRFTVYAEKAFNGVIENYMTINDDGLFNLENICLVAGLGGENHRDGSYEYYISEPIVKNDAKGIAPLLMVYSEILRILLKKENL